ncbi:MAG: RNA polymerase sigma factor [Oscillospiraceae bacterium]
MDDERIVDLFFQRDERAITETSAKYGGLCTKIAHGILGNPQDSEEIVNQSYLRLWNAVPPTRPDPFPPFLAKIVRNLALNKLKADNTQKRRASEFTVSLDELDECIPDKKSAPSDALHIRDCLNTFLKGQKREARSIFVLRYFYCESIEDIAQKTGFSESKVKSTLFRMRGRLKDYLESEGISV